MDELSLAEKVDYLYRRALREDRARIQADKAQQAAAEYQAQAHPFSACSGLSSPQYQPAIQYVPVQFLGQNGR